ncbi:MAG: universal stress protein [Roseivirga sp.]
MKNILVPTDFSPKSFSALMLAKQISEKSNGTRHLLHVVEPISGHFTSSGEYAKDDFEAVYARSVIESAGRELKALSKAHENGSLRIDWQVVVGDPYSEVAEKVQEVAADLVIIGAKGITDSDDFFLGSLTDKIVRNAPCPVITVKAVIDDTSVFRNIVYATDLQEEHRSVISLLSTLQNYDQTTIHIVRVNTPKNFRNDIDVQVELEKLADRYELENYTLNTYSHEDEEYGIVYFADEVNADLIVMGIHEKSGFRRLISGGSLVNEVTDHTFRPVLTSRFDSRSK